MAGIIEEPVLSLVAGTRGELEAITGLRHVARNNDAKVWGFVWLPLATIIKEEVLALGVGVASSKGDGIARPGAVVSSRQTKVSVFFEGNQAGQIIGVRDTKQRCKAEKRYSRRRHDAECSFR